MKKIAFKIGFSNKIGSGHFFRSLTLAKKLKSLGTQVTILSNKNFTKNIVRVIKKNKISLKKSTNDNLKKEKNFIEKNKINNVIIDDPNCSIEVQKKYKIFVKNLIIYQDIPKRNFCDVLINHNIITNIKSKYIKLSKKKTIFFLGPEYFYFKKSNKIRKRKANEIVIFFGGFPAIKIFHQVLNILSKTNLKRKKILCFLGFSKENKKKLEKKFNRINIKFYKISSQKFFTKKLSNASFFIGSGGTALFESIYFNIPSIVFCTADNQINNCINLSKSKKIFYMGKNNFNKKFFKRILEKLIGDKYFLNYFKKKIKHFSNNFSSKNLSSELNSILH